MTALLMWLVSCLCTHGRRNMVFCVFETPESLIWMNGLFIFFHYLTSRVLPVPSDLPKEAIWLKRVGIHAMVTFPCLHNGAVHGVLTFGITTRLMDHL